MVVLCGRLDVIIVEACGLTNLDKSLFNPNNKSDPYCVVELKGAAGSHRIGKTFTIDDCLNPKWFYKIGVDIRQDVSGLRFIVKDRDCLSSETIGEAFLCVKNFTDYQSFDGSLNLTSQKGVPAGQLFVSVRYSGSSTVSSSGVTLQDRVSLKAKEINRSVNRAIAWRTSSSSSDSFANTEMAAFLHGSLDIVIERATNLPNLDSSILSLNKKDVSDPYVVVSLQDADAGSWKVATTSVIDNNLNPIWNEKFRVEVCHNVVSVTFAVRDKDFVSSEIMGSVTFSSESIISSGGVSGTFDLFKEKSSKKVGQLTLSIIYTGKHAVKDNPEVLECLFPMRRNNRVTLYQDAHCPMLPNQIITSSGYPYVPRSTWRDMYETITEAQTFIFVVGWSVSAKISLLRWPGEDSTPLGHLLLMKANEGVRVRILLWDELTSNEINKTGAMSTEDEETSLFFKGTPVVVKLAPRDRYTKDMFSTKNSFTKMCYTHHQKCVIADKASPEMPGLRHVIAYVGGLDLTGGRFDTPEHPLFRTLIGEHRYDFRNRMHITTSASGPREPWHDIHSRVEGPAAMDVLQNFQERWNKQGDGDNNIIFLQSIPNLKLDYQYTMPDSWNVQMFRSINSDSAIFDWQTAVSSGLTNKKGRAFDSSIHRAYIHQIRRAKHFIYIENQYFLGSAHAWLDCRDAKVGNLIPLEIAARIEEKILAGERFVAYIVTPMFPEGKPADKATQEILHWQFRTMQMMYHRVASAILSAGLDSHPLDYLLFLCLAKKEGHESVPPELIAPEDPAALAAFEHRRLMIYVHSKMVIFDDEYVIVGSANINDRSMSGNRDTEIAIGGYQPSFAATTAKTPYGEVSLFRQALWSEHMGVEAPLHMNPSSVECVREVRRLGEEGLAAYNDDTVFAMKHHLLVYPLCVDRSGKLNKREDCPYIPDTTASVMGARSKVLPTSLTT